MNKNVLRNKDGLTEEEFLATYNEGDYKKPSVTVDMLLFTVGNKEITNNRKLPEKELKILLIKRKDHPYIGQWAIPGGFMNIDECLEEAVYRELKEETNIKNVYMEQLYTWGKVNRDPRMRVLSVSHMALVPEEGLNPIAGDDAEEVKWFSIKKVLVSDDTTETVWNLIFTSNDGVEIKYLVIDRKFKNGVIYDKETSIEPLYNTENMLAFDHADIINYAVDRLKNKIDYTPIVFNLMPKYFTLTELQQVYEVIKGEELITPNFRRKIKDMVKEVPRMTEGKGHRPAKLFKYNG